MKVRFLFFLLLAFLLCAPSAHADESFWANVANSAVAKIATDGSVIRSFSYPSGGMIKFLEADDQAVYFYHNSSDTLARIGNNDTTATELSLDIDVSNMTIDDRYIYIKGYDSGYTYHFRIYRKSNLSLVSSYSEDDIGDIPAIYDVDGDYFYSWGNHVYRYPKAAALNGTFTSETIYLVNSSTLRTCSVDSTYVWVFTSDDKVHRVAKSDLATTTVSAPWSGNAFPQVVNDNDTTLYARDGLSSEPIYSLDKTTMNFTQISNTTAYLSMYSVDDGYIWAIDNNNDQIATVDISTGVLQNKGATPGNIYDMDSGNAYALQFGASSTDISPIILLLLNSETISIADYYPLPSRTMGFTDSTDVVYGTGSLRSQSANTETINSNGTFMRRRYMKYTSSDELTVLGTMWDDGSYCVQDTPINIGSDMEVGRTYTVTSPRRDYGADGTYQGVGSDQLTYKVEGSETITVQGVTYTAYKFVMVDVWTDGWGGSGTETTTYWLVKDIGPVRVTFDDGSESQTWDYLGTSAISVSVKEIYPLTSRSMSFTNSSSIVFSGVTFNSTQVMGENMYFQGNFARRRYLNYNSYGQLLVYGTLWSDGSYCILDTPENYGSDFEINREYQFNSTRRDYNSNGSYQGAGSDNVTIIVYALQSITVQGVTYSAHKMHMVDQWSDGWGNMGTDTFDYWLVDGIGPVKIAFNIDGTSGSVDYLP